MNSYIMSRLIAILLIGILLGVAVYHQRDKARVKAQQLGREDYLARQSLQFDRLSTDSTAITQEAAASVVVSGCLFGVYELVAFGILRILNKASGHDTRHRRRR